MYRLSKHVVDPRLNTSSVWRQPYTGQKVHCGKKLRKVFQDLLILNSSYPERDEKTLLLQVLAAELAQRGFLIPDRIKTADEDEYLDSVMPTLLVRNGFFYTPTAYPEAIPKKSDLVFLGVPCDLGAAKPGTRFGPDILREKSMSFGFRGGHSESVFSLKNSSQVFKNKRVFDLGNINLDRRNIDVWLKTIEEVLDKLPSGVVPFMVGGDHSLTLAAVSSVQRKLDRPITLVQIDSHLDLQIWGDFNGSKPLNLDLPIHSNFVSHIKSRFPKIDLFQAGIRNYQTIDPQFSKEIKGYLEATSTVFSDFDFQTKTAKELGSHVGEGKDVYLTVDVDVMQSALVKTTGYPSGVGINFSQLINFVRTVIANNNIVGVDVMEFGSSPYRDAHQEASELVTYLILEIIEEMFSK